MFLLPPTGSWKQNAWEQSEGTDRVSGRLSLFVPHGPGCGIAAHQTQKKSTPQVGCFCTENRFKPSKFCETAQAGHSYLDESKRHHLLAAAHGALTTGHRQQLG